MSSPAIHPPLSSSAGYALRPVIANLWVPIALLLLIPAGNWIEGRVPFAGVTWDPFWARISILLGINLTLAIGLQLINGIAGQFSLGHAGFMAVGAYLGGYAVTTYGAKPVEGDDPIPWLNPGGAMMYFVSLMATVALTSLVGYAVYHVVMLTRRLSPRVPAILVWGVIVWIALDLLLKGKEEGDPLKALSTLSTIALAITSTYDYLLTHSTPLANALTSLTPESFRKSATLLVSLLGGGLSAAIVGLVVGLPTLRLRGDYLAIATLGVSELIGTGITNSEPLGRATGLSVPSYAAEADAHTPAFHIFPWVYGVALLSTLLVYRLQRSPKGRALQCLREDEIAANAVGINVTSHKVLAFVIGAALAGVAGALFAHYDGYLNPKQFSMQRSIELVVIVTLGGLGSIRGTLIACLLLTLLQPLLQTSSQWLPAAHGPVGKTLASMAEKANEYRLVIYALLLILAMLARSRGWFRFGRR